VKGVGEPCAGEPHARFDGRGLETERYGVTAPAPDPTILSGDTAVGSSERTEVRGPIVGREGETGWYSLSFKFDEEFPEHYEEGWGQISQFHTEADGSPPVSIVLRDTPGQWSVMIHRYNGTGLENLEESFSIFDAPVNNGTWHDLKLEVKWSESDTDGYGSCLV
jgi:hypothetical protein